MDLNNSIDRIGSQMESVYSTDKMFYGISDAIKDMGNHLELVEEGFGTIESSKQNLIDSITNIAAVAEESVASTEEVTSLMLSETNSSEILYQMAEAIENNINELGKCIAGFNINSVEEEKDSYTLISCVDAPIFHEAFDKAREAGEKLGVNIVCKAPTQPFSVSD